MHQALPPASFVLSPRQGLTDAQNSDPLLILCKAVRQLRKSGALPPTHHDYPHQRQAFRQAAPTREQVRQSCGGSWGEDMLVDAGHRWLGP